MSPARWGHPGGCPPAWPARNVISAKKKWKSKCTKSALPWCKDDEKISALQKMLQKSACQCVREHMSKSRKDKNERPRQRVRRSLWRRAGPQEENPMQKVRRSLKRGAGPRTTLLTGSGYKRYHTKRKARRNGHEGEPRECLQPAFTARSSSISMRQNTTERDQPGAEITNFANMYSKKRKIIPV